MIADTHRVVHHAAGDPSQQVHARSSTKSLQALPMFDSGAAESLGLTPVEIAIAVSSHNGEAVHVAAARQLLERVGLDDCALRCGPQQPAGSATDAEANRISNNCSGKHAGFLATAVSLGDDPANYLDPASTVQQEIRQAVLDMTGVESDELSTSIDGCSAPTFRLPIRALATGLARMANPGDLPPQRRLACRRIVDAVRSFPELVAGTSTPRFDTALIQATNGRLFSKAGAEGVQTVGIVDSGLGFAAKIDDGSTRALHRLTIAVLTRLGHLDADELASLESWHDPVRRNRDQVEIGHYELVEDRLP